MSLIIKKVKELRFTMKKLFIPLLLISILPSISRAQDSDIERIVNSIAQIENEISQKQQLLTSHQGAGKEAELKNNIADLSAQQKSLEHSLEEIASGVSLDAFYTEAKTNQRISWQSELEELIAPVLSQIKRATSRPREIEKLRTELSETDELINISNAALDNLVKLKSTINNLPEIEKRINNLEIAWDQRKKSLLARSSITKQKLDQRMGEKKNISESLEEIFHLFFKSRGRNLLLALFGAFGFWIISKRINTFIQRPKKSIEKSFNFRLFNMLFLLGSGIGSVFVFLTILFFTGDWLLLILSFFLLTGVIWNSKEAVSKFWGEALLLLNLGSVREGERVMYNGVPMKVATLGYHAILENPHLLESSIKIPLTDLLGRISRKSEKNETWFPTQTLDWILYHDKLAQVKSQSIENIILAFPGGAQEQLATTDYMNARKINLSSGFRISICLGLDYNLAQKITKDVIETLEQEINFALEQSTYSKLLNKLKVEFNKANNSSLDIVIMVDFKGEAAKDYDVLNRFINKIALEACNKHQWVIPFQQMDIHLKTGNLSS